MSKLGHSNQETMDQIDHDRAIRDGHEDLLELRDNTIRMEPDFHPQCEDQICAALVREIGRRRTTWAARVAAWEALLIVRQDGQAMADEARGFAKDDNRSCIDRKPLAKDARAEGSDG